MPAPSASALRCLEDDASFLLFSRDYSPPAPPPPPPHPPSSSCEAQFSGAGSFDTSCDISTNVTLSSDYTYVAGRGSVFIDSDVHILCESPGCILAFNISGNFTLSQRARIFAGAFELTARSFAVEEGAAVNVTGRGGDVPEGTSGRPEGTDGGGGGHGGRGAGCFTEEDKAKGMAPADVWGGDSYAWQTLTVPGSYGSKGGSTSKEADYGGGGGGRVSIVVKETVQVNGSILADGGEGGELGGGGAGGSIYIKAQKMIGNGRISACGGNGYAGGGGGRAAVDVFSRHEEPNIYVHGGGSSHCPVNAGAAGTFYDAVPLSLIVDNHNLSTDAETLLLKFPNQPLWTNIYVRNHARASLPLLWSRVQVEGQISLLNKGILSFGLERYPSSEFELLAEELLMSDSEIKVYGALRMTVKIFLMWKSKMLMRAGGEAIVKTSLLESSNMIVLKESSVIHSNANLGVHGQGLLNLSGVGDWIEAQRLVLSLFYCIHVGPGSIIRGPSNNSSTDAVTPRLHCDTEDCPAELLRPPKDCNVNSSLPFTVQICRVEDVIVEGLVEGSVIHFHRTRTIDVYSSGMISASGLGCTGGVGQGSLNDGIGSGGGHGGSGGPACYKDVCIPGGIAYGNTELPCELGSGSGSADSGASTAGGGIIIMGSSEHPLTSLPIEGSVRADGESFKGEQKQQGTSKVIATYPGGGSGGTLLMFLRKLALNKNATLSADGGNGSPNGAGGGGGGRIHFHWFDIPTGDIYQPIATVLGSLSTGGGVGGHPGSVGGDGSLTGKDCPPGLYGVFCQISLLFFFRNVPLVHTRTCRDRMEHFVNDVLLMSFPIVQYMLPYEVGWLKLHVHTDAFLRDIIFHSVIQPLKS
ncbi:hypothetical protein MLD38_006052 [Melastoma candidum]|uniref:Uncharacterized protein n=1 Tax=Melastoma candidum TaxID=119954 RepID=A0ACB9RMX0_9MYRT|nr:hypothetical protein MLD38_006052 [Melastoma candidum]